MTLILYTLLGYFGLLALASLAMIGLAGYLMWELMR